MKKIYVFLALIFCSMFSVTLVGATTSNGTSEEASVSDRYKEQTIALRILGEEEQTKQVVIANPVKQLYEGMKFRYIVTVTGYEPEWYRWKTSDEQVAEINEKTGELVAKKAGIVTITVTSKRKQKTDSYQLEVLAGTCEEHLVQKAKKEETLYVQEGIKEVMASDFNHWNNLKYVVLSESVEKLYQKNYEESSDGTRTPLKDTTTGGAFRMNNHIEAYYVDGNNRNFFSVNGVLYRGDLQKEVLDETGNILEDKTIYRYPVAKKDTVFYVPDFVSRIDEYAFAGAKNLEKVLPKFWGDQKMEVGAYAFYGCKNLKLLDISGSSTIKTKTELYQRIGNFNQENYQENGKTEFTSIQQTKLPFISKGMKKKLYFYTPKKSFDVAALMKEVYGISYRTKEESQTSKVVVQMEYPVAQNTIGIGNKLKGETYRLVVQGFHPDAKYSFSTKDTSILSVKTEGPYGYLTGKKAGTATVTCKQTYQGKTTTVGSIQIQVVEPLDKKDLEKEWTYSLGRYRVMSIIPYPKTGATYTFHTNKEGLTIKQDAELEFYSVASDIVNATKIGTYQVTIKETYKGKTTNLGRYTVSVVKDKNNYETRTEVTYGAGELLEAYSLVKDCIEPITFHLDYDKNYFIVDRSQSNKNTRLIPIKTGDTIITVSRYTDTLSTPEKYEKIGEVTVHIVEKELEQLETKTDEIPMYVGQTLEWGEIRDELIVSPSQGVDTEYVLFNLEATNKNMLSFQRNGSPGMDMTALQEGTTTITIQGNNKCVKLKVVVLESKEKYYEYIDAKK